jgi:hypothetical protein
MRKQLSQSILLLLCCLLLVTLPALAQSTPEPTLAATPDATAAPTPEVVPVPTAPGVVAPDPVIYASTFDKVIDLLIAVVLAGGGVAAIKAFRDPERGKQFITFGIDLLKMAAKFTPTTADDAALARLDDAWKTTLAGMVAQSVRDVIAEERAKLAVKTLDFAPPPPTNPVS